jgi:hypothetical protein
MALPLPKILGALFFDFHVSEPRIVFIVPMAILMVAYWQRTYRRDAPQESIPMNALRQE